MATRIRDGTSAQVWSHAASWSADTAPVSTDTAIIPSTDGIADITGENQATIDLAKFSTAPGCRVNIGSSGTPLIIGSSKFLIHGVGSVYIQNDSAGAETVVVNSPNMDTAIAMTGSAITRVLIARGGATFNPAAAIAQMVIGPVPSLRNSINVTIGAATQVVDLIMKGGRAAYYGGASTMRISGGTLTDYGAGGHSIILNGGTYRPITTNTAWTISSSYLVAGVCDLRSVEAPVTISEIFIGLNAKLLYDPSIVTITAKYDLREDFRYAA